MQKLVQQRTEMLKSMPKLLGPISVKVSDVHTGAWRYRRPVVRDNDCVRCGICAEYCPCGVIENTNDKAPRRPSTLFWNLTVKGSVSDPWV